VLATGLAAVGCGRSGTAAVSSAGDEVDGLGDRDAADAAADSPGEVEPNPADGVWEGAWLVDQPMHALYESTVYTLEPGGRVVVGASEPPDCSGHLSRHCVTGSVSRDVTDPEALTCVFGSRWRAVSGSELELLGDCADGRDRWIRLRFDEGTAWQAAGMAPLEVRVDGEAGWGHDGFDWWFRRCGEPGLVACGSVGP
jgi:hypothetical protein